MSEAVRSDGFQEEVHHLRAAYNTKRQQTNLVPPSGRPVLDIKVDIIDGISYHTYWYQNLQSPSDGNNETYQVIRLADIPGTLSGDILRLERNIPALNTDKDFEIIGDQIHQLQGNVKLPLPTNEDDAEDISDALVSIPEILVHPSRHFVKKGKYVSEVQNLVRCQGGSCPGIPSSPHVVQLLGKSPHGDLVFEKLTPSYLLGLVHPLPTYISWILQLIDGLRCLHAHDIVHRDLRIANLVFSSDEPHQLIICDLESRWGNRLAPEVSETGWTKQSDIYDLGYVVEGLIYGNGPITHLVQRRVPAPFDRIVERCQHVKMQERPSLDELYEMVKAISVELR